MSEVRTSVIVDLAGNLPRQAQRYGQSFRGFAENGERDISRLRRSMQSLGHGLDRLGNRYTALLTGAAVAGTVKGVIEFDAVLKQLAVDADITDERLAAIKQRIIDIANSPRIRVDPGELTDGVKEIIARTGSLDLALDNLENIGVTMRATGAAGQDAAGLVANFYEKFRIRDAKQMLNTLDEAAILGKAGAFELRDLATEGNAVSAAYAATGRTGPVAAREMLTLLQIIRRTTPSAAEASTSFERMIATLTSEKVQLLQKNGIQIWDPERLKKDGVKVARAIPDILKDILVKTKADPEVLAKIFDIRALRAVRAFALEFQETGALPSVEKFMNTVGDGSEIMASAGRNANTAKAALQSLKNTYREVADEIASKPIQSLADKFGGEQQDAAKAGIKAGVGIAAGLGAVLLARKLGVGKLLGKLFGKKGAAGGADLGTLGTLAGGAAGVVPVFVTNMPGMPGGGLPGAGGRKGKGDVFLPGGKPPAIPKPGPAGTLARGAWLARAVPQVALAGAVGYGVGTLIYEGIDESQLGRQIGRDVTRLFALFGDEAARDALASENRYKNAAMREKAQQETAELVAETKRMTALLQNQFKLDPFTGEIRITVDGPGRVSRLKSSQPTINMEAEQRLGPTMRAPG